MVCFWRTEAKKKENIMQTSKNPKPAVAAGNIDSEQFKKIGTRVSVVSIIVNAVLSVFKLIAGIFAHSGAMISDAIHSASDILTTVMVIVGINISSKAEDEDHPYGHERLECVISVLLAVVLALVALGIGKMGIDNIGLALDGKLSAPGGLALVAAIVSIICKEALFWYTIINAKAINSSSLRADAWHHRSDALSSVGSFIGIFGAMLGFPILDPIVSVLICLIILKVAYDIAKEALRDMVDRSCDESTQTKIIDITKAIPGVERIDLLKTRLFSSKIYIDLEIAVDKNLPLWQAHAIAEQVHDTIEHELPNCKHCMIHVNPYENPDETKPTSQS
jgi:cation diffusion facilitator family transporter